MSDSKMLHSIPTGMFGQFFRGVSYPFRALALISKYALWGPCIWPIVINAVLFTVLLVLTILYADDLRNLLWAKPVGEGFWIGIQISLWHALHILMLIIFLILDILLFALLGTVIAGPFLDVLSERVEKHVTGNIPQQDFSTIKSIVFSITDVVLILSFYLIIALPLLLINVIPVVGSVLYTAFSSAFAWLMLSLDFISIPMNRQLIPFKQKWQLIWKYRWVSLGFGLLIFFMLFIPIINFVMIPLAAVGGTIFYLETQLS